MKQRTYWDYMEKALAPYSSESLEAMIPPIGKPWDDIQAYSRVASLAGILLSKGRARQYIEVWLRMMDSLAADFPHRENDSMADFAVKEFMLCLCECRDIVPEEQYRHWIDGMAQVDPYRTYSFTLRNTGRRLHNINVYNMAGEILRAYLGITDAREYIERHLARQMEYFDENGMYMDPNCPMLYDAATRVHLQLLLRFGYNGEYRDRIDRYLKKAGMFSLRMQSAAFEFPFGGRSNQFLFNEAYQAAVFEYEACRYHNLGDMETAGQFKRAAALGMRAIDRWLAGKSGRHIKNFYPADSGHGCENYGYYGKYMISLGCFSYLASLFCEDSIEERPCPAETGGYVLATSSAFHKIFANCCGKSVEIETNADPHYDAVGIGRLHVAGVPSEYILSVPFPCQRGYKDILGADNIGASFCPGFAGLEGFTFLSEGERPVCHWQTEECSNDRLVLRIDWKTGSFRAFETIRIDDSGFSITVSADGAFRKLCYSVPVFVTNGRDRAILQWNDSLAQNMVDGYRIVYETDGRFQMGEERLANRNGEYKRLIALSDGKVIQIKISVDKEI